MDVWENSCDAQVYINAYRTIANAAREIVPEAALVWSINHVSGWDTDASAYYPGDEYVDWVGISAYMVRYFQNKQWDTNDRIDEIMFRAGRAADPVFMVKSIAETYGSRKPIMIAEGGAAHYNSVCGDSSAWANEKIREYYGWLPMVYPQIKLIAYFNNNIASESNDYSFVNSPELESAYKQATESNVFIKDKADGSGSSYVRLDGQETSSVITVASYAHFYEKENIRVEYRVDGEWAALSDKAPYSVNLNVGDGEHVITAAALAENGERIGQSTAKILAKQKITVKYNGQELSGDVPACISDGRTLVPLRLIFDAMGAEVKWDDTDKSITSSLADRTVVMKVGEQTMTKNGETVALDVPPVIMNGRTLVPVRAVAESFDADVRWDAESKTVIITK